MIMGTMRKENLLEKDNISGDLEEYLTDGRLTEHGDGKVYRIREALKKVEELGRSLTSEELASFESTDC